MGRPNRNGKRVSTAVRLPVDLHERLCQQADWRDVSVNYLVTKAVTRYLDSLAFEERDPRFGVPASVVVDRTLSDSSTPRDEDRDASKTVEFGSYRRGES